MQRRGALRVASSYQVVPEPVVLVVAGVVPMDFLALEQNHFFKRRDEIGRDAAKYEARELTFQH